MEYFMVYYSKALHIYYVLAIHCVYVKLVFVLKPPEFPLPVDFSLHLFTSHRACCLQHPSTQLFIALPPPSGHPCGKKYVFVFGFCKRVMTRSLPR